jgi:uncharacterized protein YhbP (UPF0306 family)
MHYSISNNNMAALPVHSMELSTIKISGDNSLGFFSKDY